MTVWTPVDEEGLVIKIDRPPDSWRLRAHAWAPGREEFQEFKSLSAVDPWILEVRNWASYGRVELQQQQPTRITVLWKLDDGVEHRAEIPVDF